MVTDGWAAFSRATFGYDHRVHVAYRSGRQAHELLPAVHRVASLAKRWMATTHQGGIQPEHLSAYLDEFTFRFNRRNSVAPSMIFYRLLQTTVQASPSGYRALALGLVPTVLPPPTPPSSQPTPRTPALEHLQKPWRRVNQMKNPFREITAPSNTARTVLPMKAETPMVG